MIFNSNAEEVVIESFLEEEELNVEDMGVIIEAAIMELATSEEVEAFLENSTEVDEAIGNEVMLERNIVRLDKKSKLKGASAVAAYKLARKAKDPDMKKLDKIWKMEQKYNKKVLKKFLTKGERYAKANFKKAGLADAKSNPGLVKKVVNKAKGMFNKPTK